MTDAPATGLPRERDAAAVRRRGKAPAARRADPDADLGTLRLGPLGDSLGLLLRLAQLRSYADFFARLGHFGIRPGEMSVLVLTSLNPGVRQGVVARALMIKRAHMTKMVQAMEHEGLLRRTVPPDDRRSVELTLTERGEARAAAILPDLERHEGRSVAGLTPAEEAELKRLLHKIAGFGPETGGG